MNLLPNPEQTEQLDILKDPFAKKYISEVHIIFWTNSMGGEPLAMGHVQFKNGNTKGQQDFKGTNIPEMLIEMRAFIESLRKQSTQ